MSDTTKCQTGFDAVMRVALEKRREARERLMNNNTDLQLDTTTTHQDKDAWRRQQSKTR